MLNKKATRHFLVAELICFGVFVLAFSLALGIVAKTLTELTLKSPLDWCFALSGACLWGTYAFARVAKWGE